MIVMLQDAEMQHVGVRQKHPNILSYPFTVLPRSRAVITAYEAVILVAWYANIGDEFTELD